MERLFRITLFISGAINFMPSVLAFLPEKISASYGVEVHNVDYELLLRHRAILLGIVGGLMIYSALSKKYYSVSIIIGLISMCSFILLYFLLNGINPALQTVMKMDFLAILLLVIGAALYKFRK